MLNRLPCPRFGLFVALLALTLQLGLSASVPDPLLARLGLSSICRAPDKHRPPSPAHHVPDCALCPLCTALAPPVPNLGRAPPVPLPRGVALGPAAILPAATAPSASPHSTAQPRGPPALV